MVPISKNSLLQKRGRVDITEKINQKPEVFDDAESQHISHLPLVRGWLFSGHHAEVA